MGPKFTWDVDFRQNQLIRALLEKLHEHPTGAKEGRIYYNTTDQSVYYRKNSEWSKIGSIELTSDNESIKITPDANDDSLINIEINVDDATLGIANDGKLYILDQGVNTNQLADDSITTIKIKEKSITFSKLQDLPSMTVIGNLTDSLSSPNAVSIISDENLIGGDHTNIPTTGAVIAYINSAVAGLGELQGEWDASTGTFPGMPSNRKGDYWYCTTPGNIGGVEYDIGDIIVSQISNPQNQGDYMFIKLARGQASTTVLGLVKLATDQEALEMLNDEKALTPSNLEAIKAGPIEIIDPNIDNMFTTPQAVWTLFDQLIGKYSATFGDGTTTYFIITHDLNTTDINFSIYDLATGRNIFNSPRRDLNTLTFSFTEAPESYRINIWK